MMTRLYQRLLVRLMPNDLLEAMNYVNQAYLESLPTEPRRHEGLEAAYDCLGEWIRAAERTGWHAPVIEPDWIDH